MIPKEKAQELVIKFQFKPEGINKYLAKRFALLAVDEIIEAIFWHPLESPNQELEFWEEVKQEIEKL